MVRAGAPSRSIAASSTRPFITVASMPMASAVGRDRLLPDILTPRRMLPPPTTTPSVTPSRARGDQIFGDAVDGRLVDAEAFGAGQRFAGDLDDHATVGGLAELTWPVQCLARRHGRLYLSCCADVSSALGPAAAATSAAKSDSCFSTPSPSL